MIEGDPCPECPGGVLGYQPLRVTVLAGAQLLEAPCLVCGWCGAHVPDDGQIVAPRTRQLPKGQTVL